METTEENNFKGINIRNNLEHTREILTEETTTSTKQINSMKDRNKEQVIDKLLWLCKTLQQMNKTQTA